MKRALTIEQLRQRLRGEINGAKSLRQWALQHDVSPAYVSDFLNGHKKPGKKLIKALGCDPKPRYVLKDETTQRK